MIRLLLLLTVAPTAELVVLLQVHYALAMRWGSGMGLLVTLGSIVLTGVVGTMLARYQGFAVLRSMQQSIARGELPGREFVDGVLVLLGGALLLTPGYLTDLVGFSILIPWSRAFHRKLFVQWVKKRIERGEIQVDVNVTCYRDGPSDRATGSIESNARHRFMQ